MEKDLEFKNNNNCSFDCTLFSVETMLDNELAEIRSYHVIKGHNITAVPWSRWAAIDGKPYGKACKSRVSHTSFTIETYLGAEHQTALVVMATLTSKRIYEVFHFIDKGKTVSIGTGLLAKGTYSGEYAGFMVAGQAVSQHTFESFLNDLENL